MKTLRLNQQAAIPILGFGTWELTGDTAIGAVQHALKIGYRHIDTADAYGNHEQVGQALAHSGIPRSELFITSKVFHNNLKPQDVLATGKRVLEELGIDYLDLFLVHWPNRSIPFSQTLEAMDKLKKEGLIRAIGVSNFTIHHLEDALATGVEITNNQVEYHPSLNQEELRKFCQEHKIVVTCYSPIGRGKDLSLPLIVKLAEKYHRSASQIILAWILQKGMVAIPKATDPEHIRDNFQSLDLKLDPEDIKKIDAIGGENRVVFPSWQDFDY